MPLVIPCHRVLAAGKKLGGFSAHGGAKTKQKLLALEGMDFDGGAPRLPGFLNYLPWLSTTRPRTVRSWISCIAAANCSIG